MTKDRSLSPEVRELLQKAVWNEGRKMAIVVKAMYEKYGSEAIDSIAEASNAYGRHEGQRLRAEAGYKKEDANVEITLKEIYPKAHQHFFDSGVEMERIKLGPRESETRITACPLLEVWQSIWDESWMLCEILCKRFSEGLVEGVNPKLEWHKHVEKNGAEGLARAKDKPCIIGLRLNP
jgi:hypothetical protein